MNKQELDALRKKAEDRLGSEGDDLTEGANSELRAAFHELHTHQIELELQNEELRRVQAELLETRDQYIDLYDFAPIGYLTVSDNKLISEANLTVADLLGEERRALLGRPFSQFIFQDDQDIFYKHYRELITSKKRRACELRLLKKQGGWFWAKLECVPKLKSDNSGIFMRVALQDITELKRLETELITTEKLKATALLAGGIAHDFNNLLTVILINIEMIQEDISIDRSVADKLQDARVACLGAAALAKKFLTFSSGGEPFKKPTAVKTFVTDAASLMLAGSDVNLECAFPEGLWPVYIDAGQMTQAIGNVITNSREAMPQRGVIRIHAENVDSFPGKKRKSPSGQDTKYVKISIQDQGAGIPKEIISQVFDPYFSSKKMGTKKGLGLGLAVTYSIIKKHGGDIAIVSEPNIGTTVTIYLPAYLPASDKVSVPLNDNKVRNGPPLNKKILVMDDEEMLRTVTRSLLERLGYEVEVACDGEEAVQIYSDAQRAGAPFGAVILDLTIKGGMGGTETIECLKKIDPAVRAIAASGYSNDPVMSNCREYGFLDALQKPYQLKDLEKSLENIIDAAKDR